MFAGAAAVVGVAGGCGWMLSGRQLAAEPVSLTASHKAPKVRVPGPPAPLAVIRNEAGSCLSESATSPV